MLARLEPELQSAIDTMLLRDETPGMVAQVMLDEPEKWKVEGMNFESVKKNLQRYSNKYLIPRAKHFQDKVRAGVTGRDLSVSHGHKEMLKSLNVSALYEEVVLIQQARIKKLYAREQKMPDGVVLDSLTKLFKDYNHSLGQLANLYMETGTLKRAPKTIQGTIGFGDEDSDDFKLFEFNVTQHRERQQGLLGINEFLEDALDGQYTVVEPGSDGSAGESAEGSEE